MSLQVRVSDEVILSFKEINKRQGKYQGAFFKFNEEYSEVVVDKLFDRGMTYQDFVQEFKALPPKECRYAIFILSWEPVVGTIRSKTCFFHWSPPTASPKSKMIYASSSSCVGKKLDGISCKLQGDTIADLDFDVVIEKLTQRIIV